MEILRLQASWRITDHGAFIRFSGDADVVEHHIQLRKMFLTILIPKARGLASTYQDDEKYSIPFLAYEIPLLSPLNFSSAKLTSSSNNSTAKKRNSREAKPKTLGKSKIIPESGIGQVMVYHPCIPPEKLKTSITIPASTSGVPERNQYQGSTSSRAKWLSGRACCRHAC